MSPEIDPLPLPEATEAGLRAGIPEGLAALNVFRTLLRRPPLAGSVSALLLTLLRGDRLDPRLRELVIMRVGWVTGSEYEWSQHWAIAPLFAVEPDDLLGVREWEAHAGFGPPERSVLAATDEVLRDGAVSDAAWEGCRRHVSADPEVLLELVGVIGAWQMVAVLLRSLGVELDEGLERWPPDGRAGGR